MSLIFSFPFYAAFCNKNLCTAVLTSASERSSTSSSQRIQVLSAVQCRSTGCRGTREALAHLDSVSTRQDWTSSIQFYLMTQMKYVREQKNVTVMLPCCTKTGMNPETEQVQRTEVQGGKEGRRVEEIDYRFTHLRHIRY